MHGLGCSETILLPLGPAPDSESWFQCFAAGPRLNLLTPGPALLPLSHAAILSAVPVVGSTRRFLLSPRCHSISHYFYHHHTSPSKKRLGPEGAGAQGVLTCLGLRYLLGLICASPPPQGVHMLWWVMKSHPGGRRRAVGTSCSVCPGSSVQEPCGVHQQMGGSDGSLLLRPSSFVTKKLHPP